MPLLSQLYTVQPQQLPRRIDRIHAWFVLDRRKFFAAVYLIRKTVILHFHHVKCLRFKLICIRLLWFRLCNDFCAGDLAGFDDCADEAGGQKCSMISSSFAALYFPEYTE